NQTPRLLTGDPPRSRHGHAAVEGDGDLVGHERAALRHPRPPRLELLPAAEGDLGFSIPDRDSGGAQELASSTGYVRTRVALPDDHARDSRLEHGVRARRRRAVVRARLERHVERPALGLVARSRERDALRVPPRLT